MDIPEYWIPAKLWMPRPYRTAIGWERYALDSKAGHPADFIRLVGEILCVLYDPSATFALNFAFLSDSRALND